MEYVQSDRAKCGAIFFFAPAGKNPEYYCKKLKASHWPIRVLFLETARGHYFFWPCHSLPLVMGVTMIPNIHSLTRYCERRSWGRQFGFVYLNQPVACTHRLSTLVCVGKSVASGERYYIRETNVWRDRSESGVSHVGQLSTAQ